VILAAPQAYERAGSDTGLGQVLRDYRLSQTPRMIQDQLAEMFSVDQSHISRIEKGEHRVRRSTSSGGS
jgi:hypothetical protein